MARVDLARAADAGSSEPAAPAPAPRRAALCRARPESAGRPDRARGAHGRGGPGPVIAPYDPNEMAFDMSGRRHGRIPWARTTSAATCSRA